MELMLSTGGAYYLQLVPFIADPCPLSLMNQCEAFLVQRELIPCGQFFCNKPYKYAPQLIILWILHE